MKKYIYYLIVVTIPKEIMISPHTSLAEVRTVKEAIVLTLSEEFPLSVAQLKRAIRRNLPLSVSYQAIHKEVLKLMDARVLHREGKLLLLNPVWLASQCAFFQQAHLNYHIGRKGQRRAMIFKCDNCLRAIRDEENTP